MPLLFYQRQTHLTTPPDVDLGLEVAGRARQLWEALDDAQRNRAAKIQVSFRETIARAFWEKLQYLDGQQLANALLLHPAIIQAVFGDDLPENWEDFCISFTIKNTPTKAIWRLAMTHTYQEGKRNVA
ncbi:hypothetical protein RA28_12935 [Ruegeria sp. ANG-S4]|nr:hypothetical protein RA28_12935 [Ruegeria sp. ANG-S4]